MWHCLIIEDDKENARYLADGLAELGYSSSVANDAVSGMHHAMEGTWDVIILDRMLPDNVDGLTILSALRALGKNTPVLVLSALSSLDERVSGLKAGGDDYLIKPYSFSELIARIQALIRRNTTWSEPTRLQIADLSVSLASHRVERAGRPIALQPREFRLLTYLMMNVDKVVTQTMILDIVWGYNFDPHSNIVPVLVSRLRRKIDMPTSTPLIHTVRGVGYILSDNPSLSHTA